MLPNQEMNPLFLPRTSGAEDSSWVMMQQAAFLQAQQQAQQVILQSQYAASAYNQAMQQPHLNHNLNPTLGQIRSSQNLSLGSTASKEKKETEGKEKPTLKKKGS